MNKTYYISGWNKPIPPYYPVSRTASISCANRKILRAKRKGR